MHGTLGIDDDRVNTGGVGLFGMVPVTGEEARVGRLEGVSFSDRFAVQSELAPGPPTGWHTHRDTPWFFNGLTTDIENDVHYHIHLVVARFERRPAQRPAAAGFNGKIRSSQCLELEIADFT